MDCRCVLLRDEGGLATLATGQRAAGYDLVVGNGAAGYDLVVDNGAAGYDLVVGNGAAGQRAAGYDFVVGNRAAGLDIVTSSETSVTHRPNLTPLSGGTCLKNSETFRISFRGYCNLHQVAAP